MGQMSDVELEQVLKGMAEEWTAAEVQADTDMLEGVLTGDFIGIGPLGFMLTKEEWLQRHTGGDLKYQALNLEEIKVRGYGEAAIMTARQTQKATYKNQDVPGLFRITLVWVKPQERWLLAGLHLSPIAPPPTQR
jgi:ketosteroid isomerase-like protein